MKFSSSSSSCAGLLSTFLLGTTAVQALEIQIGDDASIKKAAKTVAEELMGYYSGDQPGDTPGNLPEPYYWWEAGAMFGAIIDYWVYTDDDQFNDAVMQGMMHQAAPSADFMPQNQTRTEGNDDQAFWAIAALQAAERKFPNPPEDQPQWLALAQAVFNQQAGRWWPDTCGGGMKWQIFDYMNGYEYKNTISNACFFDLGARLARYTGNETYAEHAEKSWNWMQDIGLITDQYHFYDGTNDDINCTEFDRMQWTYNAGIALHGAAHMYNFVRSHHPPNFMNFTNLSQTEGDETWKARVQGIVDGLSFFYTNKENPDVMVETSCENARTCETDQKSFKAYLTRWMASATQVAPFITDQIMPKLEASAMAAAQQCSGGETGQSCGMRWQDGPKWDGTTGVGEQMAALEAIQSLLIGNIGPPLTTKTGATSEGDANAGSEPDNAFYPDWKPITTADKAGAGILTTLLLGGMLAGSAWLVWER
ncbi:hydrolase 76 protein [Arachnomyces sp. PD_36]|nr:hydrolase 76 protein [Arachnomyces sp. PD_36]